MGRIVNEKGFLYWLLLSEFKSKKAEETFLTGSSDYRGNKVKASGQTSEP